MLDGSGHLLSLAIARTLPKTGFVALFYDKILCTQLTRVQVGGVTRDTCAETGPWLGRGPFNVSTENWFSI